MDPTGLTRDAAAYDEAYYGRMLEAYRRAARLKPFADESFDKATAGDLLEHVDDATAAAICREARRVLRPGGGLFVYTPNPHHWTELLKKHTPLLGQDPTHIDLRSNAAVVALLRGAGLEVRANAFCASWLPMVRWLEAVVGLLPGFRGLCRYRTVIWAERPPHR